MYQLQARVDCLGDNGLEVAGVERSRLEVGYQLLQRRVRLVAAVLYRKVDIRLHGKGNPNTHGARPVYLDDRVDSDQ
jgi:hypothetical protein